MRILPRPEDLVEMTRAWTGARFPDGRPHVPDDVLDALRTVEIEQVWETLWGAGYRWQFAGDWRESSPGRRVVGRAVTAQFVPYRPDLDAAVNAAGARESRSTSTGNHNWSVVEYLTTGDVMVVDIFGKVREGTVVGDRLGTEVATRTGVGAVIDGGVRDLHGLAALEGANFYFRGTDPTPIEDVCLTGLNTPVRIGPATVMPGDVVLGTAGGVLFVPPHLAADAAGRAVETRSRDEFAKLRVEQGVYTSAELDVPTWSEHVEADFTAWCSAHQGTG